MKYICQIYLLYFFLKVQTKYTSNVLFFREVNGYTFNLFLPPKKEKSQEQPNKEA